jgi:hypothetical protein
MLGDITTSFPALASSSVGARHAVRERTRSNRTPSTETVLPMFALKFPAAMFFKRFTKRFTLLFLSRIWVMSDAS